MIKHGACNHASTVVATPVEGGGWRAHCLICGLIGAVGRDSREALELIKNRENADLHPARRRTSPDNNAAAPGRRWYTRRR